MKYKILIELIIPEIDEKYSIFIPINKKIGNVIVLLKKAISELSDGRYIGTDKSNLYNQETGEKYNYQVIVSNTDIKNGSTLILL